jgi:hypothetical protein
MFVEICTDSLFFCRYNNMIEQDQYNYCTRSTVGYFHFSVAFTLVDDPGQGWRGFNQKEEGKEHSKNKLHG